MGVTVRGQPVLGILPHQFEMGSLIGLELQHIGEASFQESCCPQPRPPTLSSQSAALGLLAHAITPRFSLCGVLGIQAWILNLPTKLSLPDLVTRFDTRSPGLELTVFAKDKCDLLILLSPLLQYWDCKHAILCFWFMHGLGFELLALYMLGKLPTKPHPWAAERMCISLSACDC